MASLLWRWHTAGGGSIPRWSVQKTQDRRPAERQWARTKNVNVLDELESLDLGLDGGGDSYPSWFCATVVLGKSVDVYETKHWAIVDMEATIKQFWAILEAVLLVSKLKAEVTFCRLRWRRMKSMATFLIFARRVIWMRSADRVARGRIWIFSDSCLIDRRGVCSFHFGLSGTACNWGDDAPGDGVFGLRGYLSCKLCTLTLAKICV